MTFYKWTNLKWTNFGTKDISFGIHVCWKGRIDIHIWTGMMSVGNIPLYKTREGRIIAVSNSYHEDRNKPIRAGVAI